MNVRLMIVAGLALALAGCTTATSSSGFGGSNAVDARWSGQSAGIFFAQFGPPASDVSTGDSTVYTWKGGYKTRKTAAQYATTKDGKRGKQTAPARKDYLSCSVQLTVSSDYTIRNVRILGDRKTGNGPSWCEQFLAGAKAE